jgi:hypothetical protein
MKDQIRDPRLIVQWTFLPMCVYAKNRRGASPFPSYLPRCLIASRRVVIFDEENLATNEVIKEEVRRYPRETTTPLLAINLCCFVLLGIWS